MDKSNQKVFALKYRPKNFKELIGQDIMVQTIVNSIKSNTQYISFIITDYKKEINVTYSGSIPNLFEEGKGVVAERKLKDKNYLIAKKILAKHDENYMPPKSQKLLIEK